MDFFKFFVLAVLVVGGVFFLEYKAKESSQKKMESAYAEGQMDAIKGDLKIKYDSVNKTWYWIKSPWNDGTTPIYDINKLKNK